MAWLNGWDKRIELTIGDYAGDFNGSVTWFPATIFLKDANGDSTKVFLEVGANSRKIAITKADGDTELKGEIEDWSYDAGTPALSVAVIHTSADGWVINANTSIFLYYDVDHADNANIDVINTAAGAAIWDGSFKMVQHMVDDTTSTILDSTANNQDGTKASANNPLETAGKIGRGQTFSSDYIQFPSHADFAFAGDFTISYWWYSTQEAAASIIYATGVNTGLTGGYLHANGRLAMGRSQIDVQLSTVATTTVDAWHYGTVKRTGTTVKIFIEGVEEASDTITTSYVQGQPVLGVDTNLISLYFAGILDEVRVSKGIGRSDAWILGSYNSGNDTLFTYGSEETEAVGNAIFMGCAF